MASEPTDKDRAIGGQSEEDVASTSDSSSDSGYVSEELTPPRPQKKRPREEEIDPDWQPEEPNTQGSQSGQPGTKNVSIRLTQRRVPHVSTRLILVVVVTVTIGASASRVW